MPVPEPVLYDTAIYDDINLIPYDEKPLLGQDGVDQRFVLNLTFFEQDVPGNEQYRCVIRDPRYNSFIVH